MKFAIILAVATGLAVWIFFEWRNQPAADDNKVATIPQAAPVVENMQADSDSTPVNDSLDRKSINPDSVQWEIPSSSTKDTLPAENGNSISNERPSAQSPERLGLRVASDPAGTISALRDALEKEVEASGSDEDEAVSVAQQIESVVSTGVVESGVTDAIRGLRCSASLCEVVLAKEEIADLAVTIAVLSRELRQSTPDYVMTVNAADPSDDALWNWYIVRASFFQ